MLKPEPVAYSVRRSQRAKHTRIVVRADRVEVVAPLKVSERRIAAFVAAHQDWIKQAVLRVAGRVSTIKGLGPEHYGLGALVPVQGRQLPLQIKATAAKTCKVQVQDEQLLVYLPANHVVETRSDIIRLAIIQWLKQQAALQVQQMVQRYQTRLALLPRSIRIKTQKSRWGSCGPQNDININWLLMLVPPIVMEYVVLHELCHIRHKNHSADFWGLVAEHMPDYQQHRRWLKQHGASVMQGL